MTSLLKLMPIVLLGFGATKGRTEMMSVGKAAIDLALGVRTSMDLDGIMKMVYLRQVTGRDLPTDLADFVRENAERIRNLQAEMDGEAQERREELGWTTPEGGPNLRCPICGQYHEGEGMR